MHHLWMAETSLTLSLHVAQDRKQNHPSLNSLINVSSFPSDFVLGCHLFNGTRTASGTNRVLLSWRNWLQFQHSSPQIARSVQCLPVCLYMHACLCAHMCMHWGSDVAITVPRPRGAQGGGCKGREETRQQVSEEQQSGIRLELKYLCQVPKATQMCSSPWNLAGGSNRCRFWRLLH